MADVIIRRKNSTSNQAQLNDELEISFFNDGYLDESINDEEEHYFDNGYIPLISSSSQMNDVNSLSEHQSEEVVNEEGIEIDDDTLDNALFATDIFSTADEHNVETAFEGYILDDGFDEEIDDLAFEDLTNVFDLPDEDDDTNVPLNGSAQGIDDIDFDFYIEEQAQLPESFSISYDGAKDTEEIASDFAIRLMTEFDLDIEGYDTLFSLFLKSSYQQTAIAISNGLNLGLTTEEIGLAAQLKSWWSRRLDFMTKIERITKRGDYSSRVARKILSWNQSFKIIQAFDGCPSIEELEIFVEDLFEYWNSYRTLQREFKSFQGFLLHICESVSDTQWMIPNYTNLIFQNEILCLCRSWYAIEDSETRTQIQSHVRSWR